MLWKVHYFGKRWFFSWNISSWCMPKFDRFLIIWNEFYSYVQGKKHLVSSTIFVYLRLSYALYGTFFWKKKRWFFMNYFKFVHAPPWKIPYYMTGFLSICTRQEALGIFNMPKLESFLIIFQVFYSYVQGKKHSVSSTIFLYLRLSYALYGIFLEKDDFSWNISSWCRPQLERFLIIWQGFYPYVQGIKHSVSSTIFLSLRLPHTQ